MTQVDRLEDLSVQCQMLGLQAMRDEFVRYNLDVQVGIATDRSLADLLFDGRLYLDLPFPPYLVRRAGGAYLAIPDHKEFVA